MKTEEKPSPDNKQPELILPIADHVTFESNKGVIKMMFFTGRLDKTLMPNHMMKLSEIVMNKEMAKDVATALMKHAMRGDPSLLEVKKTPLPQKEEKDKIIVATK